MTDIVARLERLMAENEQLRREIRRGENSYHEGFAAGFKKCKAEVERLQDETRRFSFIVGGLIGKLEPKP